MLGTIQALNDAKVQTPGTITFVADVGEADDPMTVGPLFQADLFANDCFGEKVVRAAPSDLAARSNAPASASRGST